LLDGSRQKHVPLQQTKANRCPLMQVSRVSTKSDDRLDSSSLNHLIIQVN
jgi:hypothetical protein